MDEPGKEHMTNQAGSKEPAAVDARLRWALREAIDSITGRGVALFAQNPDRLAGVPEKPFTAYLPALADDLQTPAFDHLLRVTRDWLGEKLSPSPTLAELELLRLQFWLIVQEASPVVDWSHPQRTARNAVAIAAELGWSAAAQVDLYWGALLHDVGKLFVEELAGCLAGQERQVILACIRVHAALGGLFMATAQPLFRLGFACAAQHQESIDGTGYPLGLTYAQISSAGVITGLADSYDAVVTRTGWTVEMVIREEQEIHRKAGYPDAPEWKAFFAVVQQYHPIWYAG
jgi:hypothetical protein